MMVLWRKYRNWLLIGGLIFWMGFVDQNNLVNLYKYRKELSDLRSKKAYYESEIERMKKDRSIIFNNEASLERYAREKYLMKRDNEDIYIIK